MEAIRLFELFPNIWWVRPQNVRYIQHQQRTTSAEHSEWTGGVMWDVVSTLVKSLNMRKIIVLHLTNGPSSGLNVLGNETNVGREISLTTLHNANCLIYQQIQTLWCETFYVFSLFSPQWSMIYIVGERNREVCCLVSQAEMMDWVKQLLLLESH